MKSYQLIKLTFLRIINSLVETIFYFVIANLVILAVYLLASAAILKFVEIEDFLFLYKEKDVPGIAIRFCFLLFFLLGIFFLPLKKDEDYSSEFVKFIDNRSKRNYDKNNEDLNQS